VKYVLNQPRKAGDHFFGLCEATAELLGFAIFDRLDTQLRVHPQLVERMWRRREIENYLCQPETLTAYAEWSARDCTVGPLFEQADIDRRTRAMQGSIEDLVPRVALRDRSDRW